MHPMIESLPAIVGVESKALQLEESFEEMAGRFAHETGSVALLSGGDLDCARYHLLAIRPWLTLRGRLGQTHAVIDGRSHRVAPPPLDLLEFVLEKCRLRNGTVSAPVYAGLFGYLAYDLKDSLETLPRTVLDDLQLPHLCFFAPTLIVVQDRIDGSTTVYAPIRQDQDRSGALAAMEAFRQALRKPHPSSTAVAERRSSLRSNVTRPDYVAAVHRIREYIAAGDVYQVNLSQRFEIDFAGNGFGLFRTLYGMNPAPFFAYVNAGDHQIVSTSPERFLLRSGRRVETRPIKGTRPRGLTPEADMEMRAALTGSAKDDAELSMIVDLLRNDIGKVCAAGSVVVTQHKRLEAYQNVYHLVSIVEGDLAEGKTSVDLIRATFPGGSITGCPKIRSMEIIDELESRSRHVYTGSIGYISFHDTMDLSIAIRTATIVDGRLCFSVGGGIVHDSDPEDEYMETLHKGQTLIAGVQQSEEKGNYEDGTGPWVWQDGRLVSQKRAVVGVSDLGLQYGFGFFETIRVERSVARRLPAHLERFTRTWDALFSQPSPDVAWTDIIPQVVARNGLADATAAVKLLATRGEADAPRFNGTLLVTARPYIHRLAKLGTHGLQLATYPHPRLTPLADHKTLNYLYYYQAGVWAGRQGADEALILNPDGTLSETNTANIVVISGRTVIRPRSPHVLPGVMQAAVCRNLEARGFRIEDRELLPEALTTADTVLLTNALMGAVPALSLDGRSLRVDPSLVAGLDD